MKTIPLSRGLVAIVDDEDFEFLSMWKWHAHARGYAARTSVVADGLPKKIAIFMHREILGLKPGDKRLADHVDGNTLNNSRGNLRICSWQDNNRNRRIHKNNTSGFKGVCWHQREGKWVAQMGIEGKIRFLGYFDNPEDASNAYRLAADEIFGEFAVHNSRTAARAA